MFYPLSKFGLKKLMVIFLVVLSMAACQGLNSPKATQFATQDVGEEPPTLLASPTPGAPATQKRPADADSPAAGICASSQDSLVLINIVAGDMPDPRCIQVTADQRLQFKNETGADVHIQLGQLDMTLQPGEMKTFDIPCGDFLEPGVHWAVLSSGVVSEIWLPGK